MATEAQASAADKAVYSVPYRDALAQAAASGKPIMSKVVHRLLAFSEAQQLKLSDLQAREHVDASVKLLRQHRQVLCEQFPGALLSAFAKSFQATTIDTRVSAKVHFDQLELMALDQVQESIVLARTQQVIVLAVDAALVQLNTYICAALGLPSVRPECNPLRPEIFLQAMQDVITACGVPSAIRLDWLQHSAELLGHELSALYASLIQQLRADGVLAVGFAVARGPGEQSSSSTASSEAAAQGTSAPRKRGALQSQVVLTLDKLNQLLAGDFEETSVPQVQNLLRNSFGDSLGDTQPLGVPQLALQHSRHGHDIGQEVVRLMVDNIVNDDRLLGPVQQIVRTLEPTLLRLAAVDPRFLSDRQHPARLLLEKITQLSQGYQSVAAPGFSSFNTVLHKSVAPLVEPGVDIDSAAAPFDRALDVLQTPSKEEVQQRQRAMEALQTAEQRNLLAQKIAKELAANPEVQKAVPVVSEFLCGPWAQVAAHVQLTDKSGASDPGKVQTTVDALLWSAQPELTRKNVGKLTRLVPKLLTKLREGLALIQYPQEQTEAFFESLFGLHQQALKPLAARLLVAPAQKAADEEPVAESWVAPLEAAATGFMQDLPNAAAKPEAAPVAEGPSHSPEQAMPIGTWAELLLNGQWVRTQLTWATPHGSMFLFTDASGGCQSMTKRSRDKRLLDGSMRIVQTQTVVDDALDAVAQTAMRNSIDAILKTSTDNILI
ncbi:Protein of unknown function [Rhodoferax sp. OV413]|uniref:DUF1631 family protein n=1 Tax=Rhodoferax sp. OV413 TaxID=1855285 RepID=UPI00088206A3|nr:DUF1631 family protein [Rhodoferax sp. OV413]SDN92775.1 Protein of unknown function [Rhodoferax sp. OV413]